MIPWGERYNQSRRLIMRHLLKGMIGDRTGLKILDFGAQSIHKLKNSIVGRETNYAISASVDTDRNQVLNVDVNPENEPDILMDLNRPFLLEAESVDICIAGDIIEHLYHSKQFVSEFHRILKPGGMLLISTPNMVSLFRRIKWFAGGIPALASHADLMYGIHDHAPEGHGHIHDFNFSIFEGLLRLTGFTEIQSRTDGIHLGNRLWIPAAVIPKTIGDSMIVIARKPLDRIA